MGKAPTETEEAVASAFIKKAAPEKPAGAPGLAYYDYSKVMSFNAYYNIIIGARGLGKTFGAKKLVISRAIKTGEQFVYLRRYKDELKVSKDAFFADIAEEFPEWDFRINGYSAEMAPAESRDVKGREWQLIGHFVALSTAQSRKGVSYHAVKWILFDEFIIEKGATHYLPQEDVAFLNFYSTVDRWKDKTRVFFLANAVSMMNPYFLAWDIKPDQEGEFVKRRDGYIACHFADSAAFSKGVYQTAFGKFIAGSEYADYAVGSEFADNHDHLLQLKTAAAKYVYTVETKHGMFSVWLDGVNRKFYIQGRRPKQEIIFTMLTEKMAEGKTLIRYNDKLVQTIRTAFNNGNTLFDNAKTRNAFAEIFKR